MALDVTSPAFVNGGDIPSQYTCDGRNIQPPLEWSGAPGQTRSFAVICDDPDAPSGTFTHWVQYNIPSSKTSLGERESVGAAGVNSFGKSAFGGPCPPPRDPAHHYHFHVYALDIDSLGHAGLSKQDALQAMKGHVLSEGELVATYKRHAQ
jgi:Raf kinase inhibitor-like YbhB/YbcL family protein